VPGEIVDDYYNRWVKVKNNKGTGWVFGAYTYETDWDNALLFRDLYRRGQSFASYQDYFIYSSPVYDDPYSEDYHANFKAIARGVDKLNSRQTARLAAEYLFLEKVGMKEYQLNIEKPDDLISLYIDAADSNLNPILITTDLVAHIWHLLFDRALQNIEETYFLPYIKHFTYSMCKRLFEPAITPHSSPILHPTAIPKSHKKTLTS